MHQYALVLLVHSAADSLVGMTLYTGFHLFFSIVENYT